MNPARRLFSRFAAVFAILCSAQPLLSQAPASQSADVREGLTAIEQYQQSQNFEDATRAARHFVEAIKKDRNDAWAHYGLGLTLFRAKKTMVHVRASGVADGEAIFVAQRELEKALNISPQFAEAAEVLAKVAEKTRDDKALQRARETLRLSKGSTEKIAQIDAALNDTAAILARRPVTSMDYLRRARVLFNQGQDKAGAEAYFAGVKLWDDAALSEYLRDAEVIATPEEVSALTIGSSDEQAKAVSLFWQKRAVRDGITVAERIAEHYRRIAHAKATYANPNPAGRGALPGSAVIREHLKGLAAEVDARGLIYIRYGKPTEVQKQIGVIFRDNETWAYRQPDGQFDVYRFATEKSSSGFHLVWDVFDLLDGGFSEVRQAMLQGGAVDPTVVDLFTDQSKYDPRYAFMGARLLGYQSARMMCGTQQACAGMRNDRVRELDGMRATNAAKALNTAREQLKHDNAVPRFDKNLALFYQLATFKGNGCTDVVYSVAVPAPSYRLNVTIADTISWIPQMVDSVVAKELPAGGLLRASGSICAKSEFNAFVRLTASTSAEQGITGGGELNIPDYGRSSLSVSGLLFAAPTDGPFKRGNVSLALVPPRRFKQGDPFRLFYEIYNLPAGRQYRTDISFETKDSNPLSKLFGGKRSTRISFDGVSGSGAVQQELRTVVPQIEAGKVEVSVTVTDKTTGEAATSKETIWIVPKD